MRVKYLKLEDLAEMESTVNLLMSQGWERESMLTETEDREWLITLVNYDRRPAYYQEANVTADPRATYTDIPELEISMPEGVGESISPRRRY